MTWQKLQDEVGKWSEKTFPQSTVETKMEHLKLEAQEVIDSKGEDIKEWADVTLLLIDAARKQGLTIQDLFNAASAKLEENKRRTWGKDMRHIKGNEP